MTSAMLLLLALSAPAPFLGPRPPRMCGEFVVEYPPLHHRVTLAPAGHASGVRIGHANGDDFHGAWRAARLGGEWWVDVDAARGFLGRGGRVGHFIPFRFFKREG